MLTWITMILLGQTGSKPLGWNTNVKVKSLYGKCKVFLVEWEKAILMAVCTWDKELELSVLNTKPWVYITFWKKICGCGPGIFMFQKRLGDSDNLATLWTSDTGWRCLWISPTVRKEVSQKGYCKCANLF